MEVFLKQLEFIISELNKLDKSSYSLYKDFEGNDFPEQQQLLGNLDDLCLQVTHEMATHIWFLKDLIETLTNYISFRAKYSDLSNSDLQQIVDSDLLDVKVKLWLKKRIGENYNLLYNTIRADWERIFPNHSYHNICEKLKTLKQRK